MLLYASLCSKCRAHRFIDWPLYGEAIFMCRFCWHQMISTHGPDGHFRLRDLSEKESQGFQNMLLRDREQWDSFYAERYLVTGEPIPEYPNDL